MKAFVTGSTGFLGNNLVRQLVAQGHEVVALMRSTEKGQRVLGDVGGRVTFVQGDMTDIPGFAAQLDGCDVLFHAAAYFREYFQPGSATDNFERININATRALLTEAERRGVRKAIYVSSTTVIGMKPDGAAGDETTAPDPRQAKNLYAQSKVRAEAAVFDWLKDHTMPVVLVLPGWMYGPSDYAPTSAGQIVLDVLGKKMPGIPEGGSPVADVRDVADAMIRAVDTGKSGERYILGGKYATLNEIITTVARVGGVAAPRMQMPFRMVAITAPLLNLLARRGIGVYVPVEGMRDMARAAKVDSRKAERVLGATFRPLAETLADQVAWNVANVAETAPKKAVQVGYNR